MANRVVKYSFTISLITIRLYWSHIETDGFMIKKLILGLSLIASATSYSADADVYGCFDKMKEYCTKNSIKDCSYSELNKNSQMRNEVGNECYNTLRKEEEQVQQSPVYECMEFVKASGCSYLNDMKELPKEVQASSKALGEFLAKKQEKYEQCMKENVAKIPARCREKLNL